MFNTLTGEELKKDERTPLSLFRLATWGESEMRDMKLSRIKGNRGQRATER
jgi:hypothetical protein